MRKTKHKIRNVPKPFKSVVEIIDENFARKPKKKDLLLNQVGENYERYSEVVVKGDNLRKARIAKGWTQEALAEAIHKKMKSKIEPVNARKAISKYELQIRNPSLTKAKVIAAVLRVPFSKIFTKGIRFDGLTDRQREVIRNNSYTQFQKLAANWS